MYLFLLWFPACSLSSLSRFPPWVAFDVEGIAQDMFLAVSLSVCVGVICFGIMSSARFAARKTYCVCLRTCKRELPEV